METSQQQSKLRSVLGIVVLFIVIGIWLLQRKDGAAKESDSQSVRPSQVSQRDVGGEGIIIGHSSHTRSIEELLLAMIELGRKIEADLFTEGEGFDRFVVGKWNSTSEFTHQEISRLAAAYLELKQSPRVQILPNFKLDPADEATVFEILKKRAH